MLWLNGVLMCEMKCVMMWKYDQNIEFSGKEKLCWDCY